MRKKFPAFWVIQFIILMVMGTNFLFFPEFVLQFYRGHDAPVLAQKPEEALYDWVLGIKTIDSPSDEVRQFFVNHTDSTHKSKGIWAPHDPSLSESERDRKHSELQSAVVDNATWKAFQDWLLTARPKPDHKDEKVAQDQWKAITQWIKATDEVPAASEELIAWVKSQDQDASPPIELRRMILEADQQLPTTWQFASDYVRLAAPCVYAAAFFTLFGLITPSIRRPLARIFVLVFGFWTIAILLSSLGAPEWDLRHATIFGGLIVVSAIVLSIVKAAPSLRVGQTMLILIALWWIVVLSSAIVMPHQTQTLIGRSDVIGMTAVIACLGIINGYYWLIGKSEDPPQDDGGIAQRRPPQLWTLWLIQFLILMANGLVALLNPEWMAELFTRDHLDYLTSDIVDDSIRILGAWIIALSLFSYFALGVGRDWVWQGIGWIFCIVFLVLGVSTLENTLSGSYTFWQSLYGFQGILFIPITVILLFKGDPWSTENVEKSRRGDWSIIDLFFTPPLIWSALVRGRRRVFRHGVGLRGHMRLLSDTTAPGGSKTVFTNPGREYQVLARFSNRTCEDDASLDIRGVALSFCYRGVKKLDMMFVTGAFSPMRSVLDFRRLLPGKNLRRQILRRRHIREGLAAGMRRAPASYAHLSYYQQTVMEWMTPDATQYLAGFRLVPVSAAVPESDENRSKKIGLPDDQDLHQLWVQERRADESRSPDYLRRELSYRVREVEPITFRLEAQFHRPQPGDSLDWYDTSLEWDDRLYPWVPLSEITLDAVLSDAETEGLCFTPSVMPTSLSLPKPENVASIRDPRSIAAMRQRVLIGLGRLRTWRRRPPNTLHTLQSAEPSSVDDDDDPVAF